MHNAPGCPFSIETGLKAASIRMEYEVRVFEFSHRAVVASPHAGGITALRRCK